ncbi:hypothetical protein GCM10023116_12010 [Kistimonas scapharcae]|uniref:Na(+)-translocating NADH-quinone reductase subunit B n=1 Tax=Kistimonas scapharcae TaxID=1036133 RepID=A0ABP8UZ55_9GAMM
MIIKELKLLIRENPGAAVNLVTNEGDIYLCQIMKGEHQYFLTEQDSTSPIIFHSISEATDYLGKIKRPINLIQHSAYDEMVGNQSAEETYSSIQVR